MLYSFMSFRNLVLYTWDLCASSSKRCGLSRSFQLCIHLSHLVAYSRKISLLIHPLTEALTITPNRYIKTPSVLDSGSFMDYNRWAYFSNSICKAKNCGCLPLFFANNGVCINPSLSHNFPLFWYILTSSLLTVPYLFRTGNI